MTLIFSFAFRPLFFLAISYGLLAVGWWGLAWSGHAPMPGAGSNPIYWHAHEMIFGFSAAAIAGFALTAVANWTRRPPVSGLPLLVLCVFWLSARILATSSSPALLVPMASADLAFNILLLALMAREVIGGNSRRNYKLLVLLGLLGLSNAAFYAAHWLDTEWIRTTLWAGLWVVVLTVNLIAGRIIPAFTGNWLLQQGKLPAGSKPPPPFGTIDLYATVATGLFALLFLWQPLAIVTAVAGFVAAALQFIRWTRWHFFRTLSSPIVWVLHLAFLWLPIGLALLACSATGLLPASTGMHALLIGAVTSMILAVASRAALGHTNRPLLNNTVTTASYVGISVTALLRIVASISDQPATWLLLATLAWLVSLGLFAWRYTSILLGPPAPGSS
jgi:uncharacterized protein involved in response to NO